MERIKCKKTKYKLVSLFAGIGGIDLGLEFAGFKCVWANDFDKYACQTYRANVGANIVEGDIRLVKDQIPNHDVLVGGLLYPITRRGLDDEGNVYQHSDDIETSLYHSKHLFGYESNHETRFIIDGIVCDENQNDDSSVAEIREQMDRNIQSMINQIKNVINH